MSDDELKSEDYDYSTDGTPYDGEYISEFDLTPSIEEDGQVVKKKIKKNENKKYTIQPVEELKKEIINDINNVQETIETTKEETQNLLDFYQWNTEKLLNDFFELGKKKILIKAKILIEQQIELKNEEFSCESCLEDFDDLNETTVNESCGHRFCDNCWKNYLSVKLKDSSRKYACMGFKCPAILSDQFINDDDDIEKYENILLSRYIEQNKYVKYCPSKPHCGNVVKINSDEPLDQSIVCDCLLDFCFLCQDEAHKPADCEMVKKWKAKCEQEYLSLQYLNSSTRPCPKCKQPIIKNGGCNHMTCPCGEEFCWACGQSYYGHNCGTWKPKDIENEKEFDTLRYEHYLSRYYAQKASSEFGGYVRGQIINMECDEEIKHELLMSSDYLIRCRHMLKYSYIFAFYGFEMEKSHKKSEVMSEKVAKKKKEMVKSKNQVIKKEINSLNAYQNLFDMHLSNLEKSTENLSLEFESSKTIDPTKISKLVVNCERDSSGLLEIIEQKNMKVFENL